MSANADVVVKRAYEAAAGDDGMRVLVDRLWPRGLRRDELRIDYWAKELAPSTGLREWFGHEPERFGEFRRRYLDELDGRENTAAALLEAAGDGRLTLLYAARDTVHNHAVVLADWIRSA